MDAQPPRPIATPCIKVCVVDGESGLCLGCYRSLHEVSRAGQKRLSDDERAGDHGRAALAPRPQQRPEKLAIVQG